MSTPEIEALERLNNLREAGISVRVLPAIAGERATIIITAPGSVRIVATALREDDNLDVAAEGLVAVARALLA